MLATSIGSGRSEFHDILGCNVGCSIATRSFCSVWVSPGSSTLVREVHHEARTVLKVDIYEHSVLLRLPLSHKASYLQHV